jgi:Divergent InlB B-repeat domain
VQRSNGDEQEAGMRRIASRCGTDQPGPRGPGRPLVALAPLLLTALLVLAVPAAGAPAPVRAAGSAIVVVHGQGRVTSEPPGAIDCPGRCTLTFAGTTTVTLRATPAAGWTVAGNAFCGATPVCSVTLGDFPSTLDVFFRPAALLQLWPNGDGAVTVTPAPTNEFGEPATEPCTSANASALTGCERFYVPGTVVTATATGAPGSTFLGWSARECPGTGPCSLRLERARTSLVARFTPLELRIRRGGLETGTIVSEPAGIACPPTCEARFPYASRVTLVARPDPATPFVSWKVGCAVSATDPRRCTATLTNSPTWVGVALGEDGQVEVPASLEVLFGVESQGRGRVNGRELSCGTKCESEYAFGEREELRATPASGWRFGGWVGACARAATCGLHVGPVTSVSATFVENLVPRLLSVKATGRRVTVRLSVKHAAQARVQVRREGSSAVLAERRFALRGGASTLATPVPARVASGRLRVTCSVSDGTGGGRTWTRVVRVAP